MMKPRTLIFASGILLLGFAVGQATQKIWPIFVQGQKTGASTLNVSGKTYVPVTLLNTLGYTYQFDNKGLQVSPKAQTSIGGTNQRASVEGCMGEQLFNGVWRLKVNKVEALEKAKSNDGAAGWKVYFQLSNGSNRSLIPSHGGIKANQADKVPGLTVAFSDGSVANSYWVDGDQMGAQLNSKVLPQGASLSFQTEFNWGEEGDNAQGIKPTKLLFEMRQDLIKTAAEVYDDAKGLQFTTSNPSFRVNLTCQK